MVDRMNYCWWFSIYCDIWKCFTEFMILQGARPVRTGRYGWAINWFQSTVVTWPLCLGSKRGTWWRSCQMVSSLSSYARLSLPLLRLLRSWVKRNQPVHDIYHIYECNPWKWSHTLFFSNFSSFFFFFFFFLEFRILLSLLLFLPAVSGWDTNVFIRLPIYTAAPLIRSEICSIFLRSLNSSWIHSCFA